MQQNILKILMRGKFLILLILFGFINLLEKKTVKKVYKIEKIKNKISLSINYFTFIELHSL